MAGSSSAIVERRAVAAARQQHHPTTVAGEPAPSTTQAGRNDTPYCLVRICSNVSAPTVVGAPGRTRHLQAARCVDGRPGEALPGDAERDA
jgi:hypothetical protein